MHIVFAASECVPWAKTGGLADVVGTLPPVLVRMGHRVTTFLPYYRSVARRLPDLPTVIESVTIPFTHYQRYVRVLDGGVHRRACRSTLSIAPRCLTARTSTRLREATTSTTGSDLASSAGL